VEISGEEAEKQQEPRPRAEGGRATKKPGDVSRGPRLTKDKQQRRERGRGWKEKFK